MDYNKTGHLQDAVTVFHKQTLLVPTLILWHSIYYLTKKIPLNNFERRYERINLAEKLAKALTQTWLRPNQNISIKVIIESEVGLSN